MTTRVCIPWDQIEPLRAGSYFIINGRPATILPDFDVETYSEAGYTWDAGRGKWGPLPGVSKTSRGLSAVGVVPYASHPSFELLCLAYDLKDGRGRRRWKSGEPPPVELIEYLRGGGVIEAHNAAFERRAWNRWAVERWGAAPLRIEQQRCSMAKARAAGLPPSLDKSAAVLGTTRKDAGGKALMDLFSIPRNPTQKDPRVRSLPHEDPIGFERYAQYNETDIIAEAHLSAHVPDLSPQEQEYWVLDQRINDRGVAIDVESCRAAQAIIWQSMATYGEEYKRLTGGLEPSQVKASVEWLAARGVSLAGFTDEDVEEALERDDLPADCRRALEIRQAVSSASIKKVHAMLARVTPQGRLHDLFNFHAAHTGRPTGDGPQPTNLPRSGGAVWRCVCGKYYGAAVDTCAWCGAGLLGRRRRTRNAEGDYVWSPQPPGTKPHEWGLEPMTDAIEVLRTGSLRTLELYFGNAYTTLAGCLRGMFIAAPGKRLISSDWTSIEAVVLACVAGEQWRIDLFRQRGKIYEKSGALVHGITYEEVLAYPSANGGHHHPARQTGKTAELALGYRGWIFAWRAFDKDGTLHDDEIKNIILAWREASPAIVELWGGQSRRQRGRFIWERYGVEGAFIDAALNPSRSFIVNGMLSFQSFHEFGQITVVITLPSGRTITYNNVRLYRSDRPGNEYDICYDRWNTNPKNGKVNAWITVDTHGGKLVENIVQAISNDILRAATVECERRGYEIVLHVYDELVAEVPLDSDHSVEELEAIMAQQLPWAKLPDGSPWPIRADGGWQGQRYHKA